MCARGQSKGIPRKNIIEINGIPLIAYSINLAKKILKSFNVHIGLSTDDLEIKKEAEKWGISTTYRRPIKLATDTAGKIKTIKHLLEFEEQRQSILYDFVLDLDISWYEVRFQDVTSGATWNESTPIAKVVRRKSNSLVVNAQVGSYCIKAVDKLGNSSATASIVSTNISGLQNFQNVLTLSE